MDSGGAFPGPGDADLRRSDLGGGIRYVDPPNRQPEKKSYFYYSENSPHYTDRLAPSSGKEPDPFLGF